MGIFDRKPNVEKLKEEKDVEGLSGLLEDKGTEAELCYVVVSALAQIGGERAVRVLLRTLGDVRQKASAIPAPIWMPGALTVGDLAHHELRRLGEPKIETLRRVLLDENECSAVREAAVSLLGEIGEPAVGLLDEALLDKDESVRKAARRVAAALQKQGVESFTQPSILDPSMALEDQLVYLLDRFLPHRPEKLWYRQPSIPPKKLRNAISSYAGEISADQVLALGDATIFGSAKKGLLITRCKLYFNSGAKGEIAWSEIQEAKSLRGFGETGLEITLKTGDKVTVACDTFKGVRDDLDLLLNELAASSQFSHSKKSRD